jgi:hypothetical protein
MNVDESHRKSKIGNYSRVKKFRQTRLARILETDFGKVVLRQSHRITVNGKAGLNLGISYIWAYV